MPNVSNNIFAENNFGTIDIHMLQSLETHCEVPGEKSWTVTTKDSHEGAETAENCGVMTKVETSENHLPKWTKP